MSQEPEIVPTILDSSTCVKKGLCTVAQDRSPEPYRLYYELHGAENGSQKMLFLMGLNNSCSAWAPQVEYFSKQPDHSVLVFDNRGVGNSETGPRGIYKTSEMAKDTIDLIKFLGWTADRSVHLIGASMGGMIAQELCLLIPERFKSVTFVCTKAGDKRDLPTVKGLYMLARVLTRTVSEEQMIELIMTSLFPAEFLAQPAGEGRMKKDDIYDNLLKRMRATKKQPIAGAFGQVGAAFGHSCPTEKLHKISKDLEPAKIAVITGDNDELIDPIRSIELHDALPGSEHILIPGVGHAIGAQVPDVFHSHLERIMNEGNQKFS